MFYEYPHVDGGGVFQGEGEKELVERHGHGPEECKSPYIPGGTLTFTRKKSKRNRRKTPRDEPHQYEVHRGQVAPEGT
jgi:hypothetical protein